MDIPKELPEKVTCGDAYGPAMKIEDQDEADRYFEVLVCHSIKYHGGTREQAERGERENLGYWAGYYDSATRERVERLFSCAHPVFGSIAEKGSPTARETFDAGVKMAKGGE